MKHLRPRVSGRRKRTGIAWGLACAGVLVAGAVLWYGGDSPESRPANAVGRPGAGRDAGGLAVPIAPSAAEAAAPVLAAAAPETGSRSAAGVPVPDVTPSYPAHAGIVRGKAGRKARTELVDLARHVMPEKVDETLLVLDDFCAEMQNIALSIAAVDRQSMSDLDAGIAGQGAIMISQSMAMTEQRLLDLAVPETAVGDLVVQAAAACQPE
jgi:hypothetical protein